MSGPLLRPIERIDGGGPDVVPAAMRRREPVVFRGLIRHWPALSKWTPEYFAAAMGEQLVSLHDFTRRNAVSSRMAAFVDWMRGRPADGLCGRGDLYLAWDATVLQRNPSLRGDFDFRALFRSRLGVVHTGLWMGGAGSHTPLHYDIDAPNLHACIHGRKRFVLFGPDQSRHMYPTDIYEWTTVFSAVDLRCPDPSRFPAVTRAEGFEAMLEPGDVLFIPIRWWHAAWCLSACVSLNGWWFGPSLLASWRLWREAVRAALHRAGLYAKDRCTCCGDGDLRRMLGWQLVQD